MANRIGGTCFLKINGAMYPVKGNWAYSPTPTKKTGVAGQDAVHGFTEAPRVPYMKGDVSDFGGISVTALQNATIALATLELANGKVVTGQDGWVADEIEVNTEEGKYELKLEFQQMTEQPSG
jgi:hypothetical protein